MLSFGPDDCGKLEFLLRREWLETDGYGNYAAGTLSGINTRHYHGLLVAESVPGSGRRVLCAKAEETLFINGLRYELGANQFPETIHPQGYRYLTDFRLDPWPVWTYQVEHVRLEKHILMLHRAYTTLVVYRLLEAPGPVALELRPLVAGRGYHSVAVENWSFRRQAASFDYTLEMMPYDEGSRVVFQFPRGRYQGDGFWFYSYVYAAETERGLEDREDLFDPGAIVYTLHAGDQAVFTVSTARQDPIDVPAALTAERERRASLAPASAEPLVQRLVTAADSFLVERDGHAAVIAGYPWFDVWRRQMTAALPGLTLATGRFDEARSILEALALPLSEGRTPDRREDLGVDSSFWFAWAAQQYLDETGDLAFGQDVIRPTLAALVARHRAGDVVGAWVDPDGLLGQGVHGVPLTWMDAWIGDLVVTPRHGKAVEINALWYLALRLLQRLGEDEGAAAEKVRQAFLARFWSPERGYLLDVVDGPGGDDASFRPNQLLAVSLHPDLLPDEVALAVVEAVTQRLLTPYGLRTLAPDDSRYHAQYRGNPRERDEAYHQGTVWPWLLGPYAEALLRVHPDGLQRAQTLLDPFLPHLDEYGLGQIAELFDAEPDYQPRGCFACAWSVAELLRVARLVGRCPAPDCLAAGRAR